MARKPEQSGGGFDPNAGKPGDIAVTGGTYNPVTQESTRTPSGGSKFDGRGGSEQGGIDKTAQGTQVPDAAPAGGSTAPPPDPDAYAKSVAKEAERVRTINARKVMEGQMAAYGLGALAGRITSWITEGYEADAIMAMVRQSPEYAERFPAMKALQARGQSMTEAEYIGYETAMTQYESFFGLPKGMLTSKDMVTKLLTNGKSAREVEENATRASASIYALPKEFRDTMQRYYHVDSGGLTAYFMDPDASSPLLEKQFVSAQIGMEADTRGVDVGSAMAESLYQYGIDRGQAQKGFSDVAAQRGLETGKGETVDTNALIGANLTDDADAQKRVERVGKGRAGRFEGGGGFAGGERGVSGIGSSST